MSGFSRCSIPANLSKVDKRFTIFDEEEADFLKYEADWSQNLDAKFDQLLSRKQIYNFVKQFLHILAKLKKIHSKIPENVNKNNGNPSINHKNFNLIHSLNNKTP